MLKIKDNINLKELEKYGFKKYYNAYVLKSEYKKQDLVFDFKTRKLCFCNWGYDILYDLIKADLVEKVGD